MTHSRPIRSSLRHRIWNDVVTTLAVAAVPVAAGAAVGAYTDAYDPWTGAAKGVAVALVVEGALIGGALCVQEGLQNYRLNRRIRHQTFKNSQMVVDGTYYPRQHRLRTWISKKVSGIKHHV